jgi:two-component system chemotaxis response regulator CheY
MSEEWGLKILIVDDSPFTRSMVRNIIVSNGISNRIIEAGDGIEAVMKYKEHTPDVVIMDVLMPKADGIQALRAIKKIDPKARVIMISSIGQTHIVQDAMRAGAIDFIMKPFDPSQFAIALSKHTQR